MSLNNNKQALFGTAKGKGGAGQKPTPSSSSNASSLSEPAIASNAPPNPPQSKTAGIIFSKTSNSSEFGMSAEARQKKINEAHEFFVKGEENLKTSFFQWKPDYLCAASNFERAGELFRTADQPKRAIKVFLLSAENYEKCNTLASAALNRTKAAEIAKDMGDQSRCIEILKTAAESWGLYGDTQRYGETLEKVAIEYELVDVKQAKDMHFKALENLCPESTAKEQLGHVHPVIIDICKRIFSFLVKNKYYIDAIKLSQRMVDIYTAFDLENGICKSLAAITILQIAQGDVVKAQRTYLQEHLNIAVYLRSKECEFIDLLVLACVNQDDDMMDKAKMHPQLNYFDKELQRIVKNLSLFELLERGVEALPPENQPADDRKASLFLVKNAPKHEKKREENKEDIPLDIDEDVGQLHDDLNNLEIPDFDSEAEGDVELDLPKIEKSEPVEIMKGSDTAISSAVPSNPPIHDEDEDDIDLS